jgi:Dimerisation and cyclophilin-binding domain of Mon2/Guanine nucleotide exchange factor in Golgi transport N-terminal/C-terminal region of Mon2 protein
MSAAIFQSELSSLIQESRRKHPDIKTAAEQSLGDLKALNVTSEAQLAGDLLRKPSFIDPFILACNSRNAKLVSSGVVCLQRLAASRALPSERLRDVLEALRETTSSAFDVQIKILQTLPSLLQSYASDVHGSLLFTSLDICAALQGSKNTVLSSTASATLQQLVSSAFERIADEDDSADPEVLREIQIGNETLNLRKAVSDGYEIFDDLCGVADGVGAKRLKSSTISPVFGLDLIITILADNEEVFQDHPELLFICRNRLMPSLLRRLSAKHPFAVTVRSLRVLASLISRHLDDLPDESETALGLLVHVVETEISQGWKRVACMETLRNVISNFPLFHKIFYSFDMKEGRKEIVSKMLAALAKTAAEKPAVIGLSRQSTIPARYTSEEGDGQEQASLEAAGVEGVIGTTVTAESNVAGISAVWSLPKTPCLEQLDKNDPPSLPDTYIYSLVLECMSSVSEGLAKVVMPVSILRNARKKSQAQGHQQLQESNDTTANSGENKSASADSAADSQKASKLINPLSLRSHPQSESIKTAAAFVTSCWPAFLASCATFLNAALDAELYHNLIRAIQKLAQVAGVLELSTPRDAFLTTLAKAAVPSRTSQTAAAADGRKADLYPAILAAHVSSTTTSPVSKLDVETGILNRADISPLTTRHLLCLRALLNLGIALGPTLSQAAWFILLETLQEAESLIRVSSQLLVKQSGKVAEDTSNNGPSASRASLSGEIAAVQTASKRMLASTANYEDDVFIGLLKALLSLSVSTGSLHDHKELSSPSVISTSRRVGRMHQVSRSTSGPLVKAATEDKEVFFVLSKTSEIARSNLQRFVQESGTGSGWSLITDSLLQVMRSDFTVSDMRLRAASLLDSMVLGTFQIVDDKDDALTREVQHRGLSALKSQIQGLYQQGTFSISEGRNIDVEIHQRAIEALISIVEQHGESLLIDWEAIFKLGGSIFEEQVFLGSEIQQDMGAKDVRTRSLQLIPVAFRLLQLIGSDFLNLLSMQHLLNFIDILLLFGRQHDDLNVSLTSTTFFWNLADFLHTSQNHPSLRSFADEPSEESLVRRVNHSEDPAEVVDSLWLVLLLRLNILTTDSRFEVRNSAIQVMLRMLDASGPSLSPDGWRICCGLILMRLLNSHSSSLAKIQASASGTDPKGLEEWNGSTVALLEGSTKLLGQFLPTISADEHFPDLWAHLFELLESILSSSSLAVSFAGFQGLTLLFSSLKKADYHDARTADRALWLWIRCHPADMTVHSQMEELPGKRQNSNQDAFAAHAELFVRVVEASPSVDLDQITSTDVMQALRKTILQCVHSPYESDVLKMAPEQRHVIDILQLLSNTKISKSTEYHTTLLDFVQVAFKDRKDSENEPNFDLPATQDAMFRNGQSPTFVAFSSNCIALLERGMIRTIQQGLQGEEFKTICSTFNVLSDTIQAKYTAKAHRGDPLLWRKATASALMIVEVVGSYCSRMTKQDHSLALHSMYGSAIGIAVGILGSGSLEGMDRPPERNIISADEEHDVAAFKRLSLTLIPALTRLNGLDIAAHGNKTSEVHRRFVLNLFRASMIAAPQYADLPSDSGLISSPLKSLFQIRSGTIKEVVYHIRGHIPYLALETLFGLIAAFNGNKQDVNASAAHAALAKSAAPYVLLRAAHTLKSFIADQPLRGPMPMPSRLRAEMIYVLKLCLELRSEDEAFVGKPGSHGCLGRDGRRHLRLLSPLILRVWNVWRRVPRYGFSWITGKDGVEIEKCLHRWMEMCGQNWELVGFDS